MKRIVILNGNHLCHNPRVIKEATALAGAGFDVEVLGVWLEQDLARRDRDLLARLPFRYTPVAELRGDSLRQKAAGLVMRGRRRLAMHAHARLALTLPDLLGYAPRTLLRQARTRDADLYIAHSEPAMWVASELAGEGRRAGIDMEDWFSEDLLPEARAGRPLALIRGLESGLLKHGAHRTATSNAMGGALAGAYDCAAPVTIYNAFPWSERETLDRQVMDRKNLQRPSVHWFSQSIGPGRGLEDMFGALGLLRGLDFELHLRGRLWQGYRTWLERQIPAGWSDRLYIHELVPNQALLSRIAEHDIGVALESAAPPSRDLTVTNKILQYMQAGLAVVATSTRGQREVAAQAPEAVRLCPPGDVSGLAAQLRMLLTDPVLLARTKEAALAAARDVFCWEKMEPRLVASVEQALA